MSFLDRFKIQPKYKSADPEVRLAAVHDFSDSAATEEERAAIAAMAREDADPRVRRAAAARIQDVEVLAAIADAEADEAIRTETLERLAGVAASSGDAPIAGRALAALREPKQIGNVAKASPIDSVRVDAVNRLTDVRTLSSVARQAADGRVALLAVERVQEPAELLNIAAKTEHKDAGIAALERSGLQDRAALDQLADRAASKSVGKRARAMVQAIDEAEAARKIASEQHVQRVAFAIASAEGVRGAAAAPDAAERLAAVENSWRELLAGSTHDTAAADQSRFETAANSAREDIAREAGARAERDAREAELAAARGGKSAICERIESFYGDDALDRVEQARSEWEGLAADPDEAVHASFGRRFQEACDRARVRHENRQDMARTNTRLGELAAEAEQLAAEPDSPPYAWDSVGREWKSLRDKSEELDPAVDQRFAAADAIIRERAEAKKAAVEKALRQQVARVDQLIERVHKRAEAEDLTLKEAEKAAKDLRAAIETPLNVPHHERDYLVERLKAALGVLAPKLHELREMDEWKRFANAAVQEELIAQTEGLSKKFDFAKPDEMEKAARELHEIQERWKTAAEAPRTQAQTLWHRYRLAADPIQAHAREFFAARAQERDESLQKKLALIERAEAIADSTDWIKTADEMKKLQAEWQALGPVPRADTRLVWKRFRDACDRFFSRRNEDLAQRKEVWSANQAKKEALCARAEELAQSREWDKAAAELRRLQADWKTAGPVRRSKSEALWQRFRTAADTFFERYKRRDEIELESRQSDREALIGELEGLFPSEDSPAPADLLEKVRSLRTRWNQSMTAVRSGADPLSARFVSAIERLLTAFPEPFKGTELDIEASRQRMEKLVGRVENLVSGAESPQDSPQDLAARLREALASNTIGGRAGEESKWRGLADEVRQAQASFARLVPVPGDTGRQLADRFHKACNRFFDQYRRKVPQSSTAPQRGPRPVGAR
ncbi:MAG TPA: DUF349 domain-containing protein [Vicinamibacterales bacterium]|jgi:hypothetical protein